MAATDPKEFRSGVLFEILEGQLKQNNGKAAVDKVKGTICFKVKKNGKIGTWVVDLKNGNGRAEFNPKGKAETTVTLDDEDLIKLLSGEMNPQQGKLKLTGNLGLAMRLKSLETHMRSKL